MTERPGSRLGTGTRALVPVLLLFPLFAGAVGLTATVAQAAAVPVCAQRTAPAGILGIVPPRSPHGCTGAAAHASLHANAALAPNYQGGNPPLLYGGGTIAGTATTTGENTVHALFWAPPGYSFPAGYETGIDTYLTDVSAASGSAANVYSVATQYTDGQESGPPHIRYDVHVGTPIDVTSPYPSSGGCTPDTATGEGYTACVTDSQMHAEMDSVMTANSLPTGMGNIYLVVFPPNVETCTDTGNAQSGGNCSDTNYLGFCGYHSAFVSSSGIALYANIPYPTAFSNTCLGTEAPNGSLALDSALSMVSHEHNETITDPLGNAWIDSFGREDGDECAWNFGAPLGGAAGAQYNQVINNDHYMLQQEFSNENYALDSTNGCALTQSVPTAAIAVTTGNPLSGLPTAVSGTGSSVANVPNGITSWSWSFGDGSGTSTSVSPTHTYTAGGTYTLSLTVTDTDGFSSTMTQPLTVGTGVSSAFTVASPPGNGTVGQSYNYTFAASGNPAPAYALSGGPAWLGINSSSGAVSGTPPARTTSFAYWVTATNGIAPTATAGPFTVAVTTTSSQQVRTDGYWLVGADGGIFSFGSAAFYGSTGNLRLQRPVVGISPTADRTGYWLVASDGGVFAFGDSGFYGSLPGLGIAPAGDTAAPKRLAAPIVAMVPSTDDAGYFMVASDGGVFAFGDARFAGSCPGIRGCSGAAVAVMPDATGNGYWLVTATGNVYAFGDAPFLGAPPQRSVAVTSAVRTPDGQGYWVLYADGRLSGFGDAGHYGDPMGGLGSDTATAVFATSDGGGYWVATAAGVVYNYGDAPADGSMAGTHLNAPVIAASGW